MKSQTLTPKEYYWIAINGASCAASLTMSLPVTLCVIPTPHHLFGFATATEAYETQQFLLNAPRPQLQKRMNTLHARALRGEIAMINPTNPEPPTHGQTMWMSEPLS